MIHLDPVLAPGGVGSLRVPTSHKNLKPGDHVLCLVRGRPAHRSLVAKLLALGLKRGCMCLAVVDALDLEPMTERMAAQGISHEKTVRRDSLHFVSPEAMRAALASGSREAVEGFWRPWVERAQSRGKTLWAVGAASQDQTAGDFARERILEYERAVDDLFGEALHFCGMCCYRLEDLDTHALSSLLRAHPFISSGLDVSANPLYRLPESAFTLHPEGYEAWFDTLARLNAMARQADIIQQVGGASITLGEEVDGHIRLVLHRLRKATGADTAAFFSPASQGTVLHRYHSSGRPALPKTLAFRPGQSIVAASTDEGSSAPLPFLVDSLGEARAEWAPLLYKRGLRSLMVVPVNLHCPPRTGGLVLGSTLRTFFNQSELQAVASISSFLGYTLDLQQTNLNLTMESRLLRAIAEMAETLHTGEGLTQVFSRACAEGLEACRAVGVSLWMLDKLDNDRLTWRAGSGRQCRMREQSLDRERDAARAEIQALQRGKLARGRCRACPVCAVKHEPESESVTIVAVPIRRDQRVCGCLVLHYSGPKVVLYEQDHTRIRALAHLISVAIETAYAQEMATEVRKMRAMETLVSGMAHDLKNSLGSISGAAQLMEISEGLTEGQRKTLELIMMGVHDACATLDRTQQLAADDEHELARASVKEIEISSLISDALRLTRSLWEVGRKSSQSIRLERRDEGAATIHGDPSELRHCLVNLIINAVDAMPCGGTLGVLSRLRPGWVEVVVTDTGVGMDEETRSRCFEPYFSTKKGRAHGLGLAMVRHSIARHGGTVAVDSTPGVGTEFVIRLPQAGAAASPPVAEG